MSKVLINSTMIEIINYHFTMKVLLPLYSDYLGVFLNENKQDFIEAGLDYRDYTQKIVKIKLAKLIAVIYTNKNLFNKFLSFLPSDVVKVYEILIWEGRQKVKRLENELKPNSIIRSKPDQYYPEKNFHTPYLLFCHTREGYYDSFHEEDLTQNLILYLPDDIRKILKTFMPPPKDYNLTYFDTITETQYIYNNDGRILKDLPIYFEYIKFEHNKFSKSGKPSAPFVKRLMQYTNSEEFYQVEEKELGRLKNNLIISLILSTKKIETYINPLDMLKEMIETYNKDDYWSINNLILHLKGRAKAVNTYFNNSAGKNAALFSFFKKLQLNKWISVNNLIKYILLRDIDLKIIEYHSAKKYLYYEVMPLNKKYSYSDFDKVYISDSNYFEAITAPYVKGSIFLFASLGLLDIAYDYPANELLQKKDLNYLSIFDGVKYIRLTELGAYIFGINKEYTMDFKEDKGAEIILDQYRLILTINGEDRMKSLILQKFADKISEHSYKMDYLTLFRECVTKKDIEEKVNFFKTKINSNPPQIWNDFFDKALKRVSPLIMKNNMLVYELSSDKELAYLIATDKILKQYITKADNFHIIIDRDNFIIVKNRFANLGYLI